MEQVTKLSVNSLKVHPRNTEFFDDIEGDIYKQFKQSIKEDGVLTPVIISPDMTIISGHQRYLACKDLGIELIPVIIREELVDEDLKVRQLIASNFGRLSNNPSKFRKAVAEYVELVGNVHGGSRRQHGDLKLSQSDIAKELGISTRELQKLLQIEHSLIPELKQSLDKGFITKTSALGICSKLDKSEQQDLLTELTTLIGNKVELNPDKDKVTASNKEVEQLISEVELLKEQNEKLTESNTKLLMIQSEKEQLKQKVRDLNLELDNRPEIEVEVEKKENKIKLERLETREKELQKEKDEINSKYRDTLDRLKEEHNKVSHFMDNNQNFQLSMKATEMINKMKDFIRDMTDLGFFSDIDKLPNGTREEYIRAIYGVYKWGRNILNEVNTDGVVGVNRDIIEIIDMGDK